MYKPHVFVILVHTPTSVFRVKMQNRFMPPKTFFMFVRSGDMLTINMLDSEIFVFLTTCSQAHITNAITCIVGVLRKDISALPRKNMFTVYFYSLCFPVGFTVNKYTLRLLNYLPTF